MSPYLYSEKLGWIIRPSSGNVIKPSVPFSSFFLRKKIKLFILFKLFYHGSFGKTKFNILSYPYNWTHVRYRCPQITKNSDPIYNFVSSTITFKGFWAWIQIYLINLAGFHLVAIIFLITLSMHLCVFILAT